MVTIPMIGWVATLGPNRERLSSFSIAKYGAQQDADWQWFPDAGNGVYPDGTPITANDPTDANVTADAAFQQAWVQHMKSRWGSGGTYLLDNEHSLWQETHRDVKPVGATMDEIASRMIEYSRAIKTADPAAIVAGPEEWGWLGYLMSGYDQQWASENYDWTNTPDRIAHGGSDYMPWLLQTIRAEETRSGQRLLDIFTLHFYPQGGEFSDDTSQAMQLRRNRSTRALWDPNYLDQTWINDYVKLIPRMRQWVNTYAPGIKIGLTEYSWGADNHMNGATAQADVLGILGRERMNVATRWVVPPTGSPAYLAIRMYRNYDGMRSTFGDTSVSAAAPNVDNVAAFASKRTRDGALTVMLVNKQLSTSAAVVVKVANFTAGTSAQRWQLAAGAIQKKANVAKSSSSFSLTLPAQSVTLLVIPKG